MAFTSIGDLLRLAVVISIAGTLCDSCIPCEFSGPQLDCVGFVPCTSAVDGECYCRVPNSVELQFGQCMELTVNVTNSSAALSCTWYANNVRQIKNNPSIFFEVKGYIDQTLAFRREFSPFYYTSLITFNCTDGGAQSSVVYKMDDVIANVPRCKQYNFRQTPYIVSPSEEDAITTMAGSAVSLGPIVTKNLVVGNSRPGGSWCHVNGKCCTFDLEIPPDRSGATSPIPCVGGLEGWTLLRSLECESGFLRFSLYKQDMHTSDSGEYVFTIGNVASNLTIEADNVTVATVNVRLAPIVLVAITAVITIIVVIMLGLCIVALVGCVAVGWRKAAKKKELLLVEEIAEPGFVEGLVQEADNDEYNRSRRLTNSIILDLADNNANNHFRRFTNNSVLLDLGGSVQSKVV